MDEKTLKIVFGKNEAGFTQEEIELLKKSGAEIFVQTEKYMDNLIKPVRDKLVTEKKALLLLNLYVNIFRNLIGYTLNEIGLNIKVDIYAVADTIFNGIKKDLPMRIAECKKTETKTH